MLVSNGKITRNIADTQLDEYKGRGYLEVKKPTKKTEPTPAKKTGK